MAKHTKEMVGWTSMGTGGLLPILLFGVALAVSAAPAGADVVTRTWIGGNPGDWNLAGNWSPSGVPNNTGGLGGTQYDVVIDDQLAGPEGPFIQNLSITINSLTINNADGFVEIRNGGILELANSGGLDSHGTVAVKAGGSFILNGGSITSREIKLEGITGTATRAKLRLNSDTTLSAPTGAEIVGTDPDDTSGLPGGSPQTPDGLIDGDGTLTLGSAATIRGQLEIQVDLVNNGLVDADDDEGKIYLTSTSKSGGSGANFKATAGLLEVDVSVSGSADWTSSGTGYLWLTTGSKIFGGDLNILKVGGNSGGLRVKGQVTLAGNLDATVTVNSRWVWLAPCKFTGGTPGSPVTIELASKDVFNPEAPSWDVAWPYDSMGMGLEVIIGADAHVKGVEVHNNENRNGPHCFDECFFVTTLTFVDGDGRYDKNGFDAHYDVINGNESQQVIGSGCE